MIRECDAKAFISAIPSFSQRQGPVSTLEIGGSVKKIDGSNRDIFNEKSNGYNMKVKFMKEMFTIYDFHWNDENS